MTIDVEIGQDVYRQSQGERTEILALDETILDGTLDAIAGLLLVSVITSSIEQTVSSLDSVVHGVGTGRFGNLNNVYH